MIRVHDAFAELTAGRLDVRAGFARVVWGRLDEIQPTDVVNPLDVSRFFFEGRSEARLPVALVRASVFLSDAASVEAVYVPVFRRGRFDLLDEPTSPFNPRSRPGEGLGVCLAIGCPTLPPEIVDDSRRPALRARRAAPGSARRRAGSTGRCRRIAAWNRSRSIELGESAPGAPVRDRRQAPAVHDDRR